MTTFGSLNPYILRSILHLPVPLQLIVEVGVLEQELEVVISARLIPILSASRLSACQSVDSNSFAFGCMNFHQRPCLLPHFGVDRTLIGPCLPILDTLIALL
eukprot:6451044-Amphidinium_carterae.1